MRLIFCCFVSMCDILQVLDRYSCKRSTCRWPMAIFYNMLDVSAYNAFVVWTEVNPLWNKGKSFRRRLFLEELGSALVFPLMERRQFIPRTPASLSVLMEAQHLKSDQPCPPKRRRCQVCDKEKKNRKTCVMCQKCKIPICKAHAVRAIHCLLCFNS